MEPKEKAKELFDKFTKHSYMDWSYTRGFDMEERDMNAKECALICVNEVLASNPHSNPFNTDVYSTMDFWQKVKEELNKL